MGTIGLVLSNVNAQRNLIIRHFIEEMFYNIHNLT